MNIDQAHLLVDKSDGDGLRNKRDFAMISILLGCGLRRAELAALNIDDIQIRQGHWAIVDPVGKGRPCPNGPDASMGEEFSGPMVSRC